MYPHTLAGPTQRRTKEKVVDVGGGCQKGDKMVHSTTTYHSTNKMSTLNFYNYFPFVILSWQVVMTGLWWWRALSFVIDTDVWYLERLVCIEPHPPCLPLHPGPGASTPEINYQNYSGIQHFPPDCHNSRF